METTWFCRSVRTDIMWDQTHVSGCIVRTDEKGSVSIERVEDGEPAQFWSVYLRDVNGPTYCVADLPTKELANDLSLLLESAVKSHVSQSTPTT